jgi:hypothetical protein
MVISVLAQMLANHKPPFPSLRLNAMYIGWWVIWGLVYINFEIQVSEFVHFMENWDPEII